MGSKETGIGIRPKEVRERKRNRIERWFRELRDRTRRFCNNVNAKTVKSLEELVSAMALIHNVIKVDGVGGVILS